MKTCMLAANFQIKKTANRKMVVFKRLCCIKLSAKRAVNVNICVQSKIKKNAIVNNITKSISLNSI